jgi:hypothetical protein
MLIWEEMLIMSGAYRINRIDEGFELLRVTYPGFRAVVDFSQPVPSMRQVKLLDRQCKASELAKAKRDAEEFLYYLSRMGE